MSHFKMPPWAAAPSPPSGATLVPYASAADAASLSSPLGPPVAVGARAAYTLGRDAALADVPLRLDAADEAAAAEAGVSRVHAAIVHHRDGRAFVIDLASRGGTRLAGAPLGANRPAQLRDGDALGFGALPGAFVFRSGGGGGGGGGAEGAGGHAGGGAGAAARGGERTAAPANNGAAAPPGAQAAAAPAAPAASVRASHLLLRHAQSRRPASHREPNGATRSPAEALRDVQALRAAVLRRVAGGEALGEVFAELAAAHSHCSSSKRGGDLGAFGPGQMQRAFEEGAFALGVGEMSGPVHSDSGVHLILRTG